MSSGAYARSQRRRLNAVAVFVALLRADLNKVLERVTTAETYITGLQSTSKKFEDQVRSLTAEHGQLAVRLEDQEERAWRNNIRVVGVPEGVEGLSFELFMETLITDYLRPKRLSTFFTVEWTHRAPVHPLSLGGPQVQFWGQ
ncbi:hypothetical protein NDU88_004305 [Pleurodeles waltl]|uniref:Uncharacterized protein n=1 Tax=Pleurodeles waltl TaxID=8319 RepID=A0AAV7T7H0_PLEWA|nr:hypothetical protein NDU88_004305 [Pleurodeles waltl]